VSLPLLRDLLEERDLEEEALFVGFVVEAEGAEVVAVVAVVVVVLLVEAAVALVVGAFFTGLRDRLLL